MPSKTFELSQPSDKREVKEITPTVAVELRQQSIQNGQVLSSDTIVAGQAERNEKIVIENSPELPSFDERMSRGLERKWAELGVKLADVIEEGKSIKVEAHEHEIGATRINGQVVFQVDGQDQNSEHAKTYLARQAGEVDRAINRHIAEEARRRAEEERRKRDEQRRSRIRDDKQYRKKADRDQRSYDAQMKGDRYVVSQMQKGADIER